jgi:hypothetical protein
MTTATAACPVAATSSWSTPPTWPTCACETAIASTSSRPGRTVQSGCYADSEPSSTTLRVDAPPPTTPRPIRWCRWTPRPEGATARRPRRSWCDWYLLAPRPSRSACGAFRWARTTTTGRSPFLTISAEHPRTTAATDMLPAEPRRPVRGRRSRAGRGSLWISRRASTPWTIPRHRRTLPGCPSDPECDRSRSKGRVRAGSPHHYPGNTSVARPRSSRRRPGW